MRLRSHNTFHRDLRVVLRANAAERDALWETFQAAARANPQWNYCESDSRQQDAWSILSQAYPAGVKDPVKSKKATLVLKACDFLVEMGGNPLHAQGEFHPLWSGMPEVSQRLLSSLVAQENQNANPMRTLLGGNPLHALAEEDGVLGWRLGMGHTKQWHPNWIEGRQRDGRTPLQLLWRRERVDPLRQALLSRKKKHDANDRGRARLRLLGLWTKTQCFLAHGARLDHDLEGLGLAEHVMEMIAGNLALRHTPKFMKEQDGRNWEALLDVERQVLAIGEAQRLDRRTARVSQDVMRKSSRL